MEVFHSKIGKGPEDNVVDTYDFKIRMDKSRDSSIFAVNSDLWWMWMWSSPGDLPG